MIEAMKRAYADRALFLGDPDRGENPVARLISKDYAAAWRATIDPAHATPASAIHAGGNGQPRRPQHHAFLGHRSLRQCGVQHLHAQFQLRRRPGRRRHRHSAQQRARRFRRQARRAERLWPDRLRGQRARPGQAAAVVDDADHRAQGRQAVSGHRLAGRQPHHHHGAASRSSMSSTAAWISRARCRRRACTINGCPTRFLPSRAVPTTSLPRCKRAATRSSRSGRSPRPIRS